ncbi:MAG: DNA repair protein RadC [Candidatus Thermoplasmatota archaeon]
MRLKEIPWYNQPGVRLRKKGASVLSDAELLAIVLGRGDYTENAVDLSNRVLARYNFNKLAQLSFAELEKEFRNPVKALKMQAMFEIFRRTNRLNHHGYATKIQNAEDVHRFFMDNLSDKKKEFFYALLLDAKNRIIEEVLVSIGILNASLIHPREVFNPAIKASAHAIILVHNHPSGECEPSSADIEITNMLSESGKLIGINVLDHVIIGKEKYISMREKGLIK